MLSPRKPPLLVTVAFTGAALVMTGCAGSGVDEPGAASKAAAEVKEPVATSPATGQDTKTSTGATTLPAGLLRSATLADVPPGALAAYQRAASAVVAADTTCYLPWTLLAAIGKVESNHGRATKTTTGVKGIFGPPLDGTKGTQVVPDTDLGTLDGDQTWDRTVGPMKLLPATWSEIAVDGDGDGVRNPQDLDDAALGAAVYLCAGSENLSQAAGARKALLGYHRDAGYAQLVLSVSASYLRQQKAAAVLNASSVQAVNLTSVNETSRMAAREAARNGALKRAEARKAAAAKKKAAAKKAAAKPKPTTPTKPTTPPRPTKPTPPTRPPAVTKVATPAVEGKSYDDAVAALNGAGLTGTVTKVEVFDPAAAGTVLASDPAAGTLVEKGSGATLTVSRGPVPDVVGKTFADAKAALEAVGLAVVTTGADATDTATVTAQTPGKDSTKVAQGATITLTITAPATPTPGP